MTFSINNCTTHSVDLETKNRCFNQSICNIQCQVFSISSAKLHVNNLSKVREVDNRYSQRRKHGNKLSPFGNDYAITKMS